MDTATSLSPFELLQADLARGMKSMLALGEQANAFQAGAALELLHGALAPFHPGLIAAARDLLETQTGLADGIATQWKNALDRLIERGGDCIGDLRRADDGTEVMGVLALFASDLGDQLHADAERFGKLLASAGEANKVLLVRALDGMIADADADAGPAAESAAESAAA